MSRNRRTKLLLDLALNPQSSCTGLGLTNQQGRRSDQDEPNNHVDQPGILANKTGRPMLN